MSINHDRPSVSRRRFLTAAAAGVSTLALAACGGTTAPEASTNAGAAPTAGGAAGAADTNAAPTAGAADTNAAPTAGAAGGTEPTAAPTPTPVVLGTGSQKVTIWHGLGGADGATFVQMLGTYASQKPDVTISSEVFSDWNVFYQKLPTATAAGTPPDAGIMHSWAIKQFATQGILQDADTNFFQPGLVPKDDFNPTLIDAITVDGKTQAVPFDNHGWLNWVNTKVIKDAGLDPNNLPKNGEEFITWAKKIVVDDAGKHPDESGFNPDRVKIWAVQAGWQRFTIVSTIWQFGGGLISDDGKKSLVNTDQTVAALQYWTDLIFKHHVAPPAVPGTPSNTDLFKSNSIALMWDGTWNLNFFKDNPDSAQVMQPMYINSLAPDGKQAVRFDSHMLIIPNGVEDPNLSASKDLIKWLSDNGETWATSGQVPARLSVQNKPAVQNIPSGKMAAAEFKEIGRPGQSHPSINEIVTAYEAAFSAALAGTTPPKQALDEANTQVQSILDRG
ncbi:MAG TPA: extracellular solute-binding protein [Roseiflexaceae bacterium]|jgi:ABC-type glycerol-3-phosphate transport system substrate-binding protein|nr:extracellular solute-binding protein [Roseiflexaceae bacterium]